MESSHSPNKVIIGIIVAALLVATATAVVVLSANNAAKENTANNTANVSPSATPASDSPSAGSEYKDGTYTADGQYQTPGGNESIGVTVTLANGKITEARVEQRGKTGEAEEFQSKFASGFSSQVVGKSIDEVSLTRVAGSSLTPNGFNDAISDIEGQAKA